ncbi:MAG TPA: hypothetical protein VKB12_18100 [Pyrinomonadaceae bacterium]|nr:hypothetical protein [Pyrinomonadaceae bacterium]
MKKRPAVACLLTLACAAQQSGGEEPKYDEYLRQTYARAFELASPPK